MADTFRGFNRARIMETCRNCQERYPACHDYCKRYKDAKAEYQEQTSIIKQAQKRMMDIDSFHYEAVVKTKKH